MPRHVPHLTSMLWFLRFLFIAVLGSMLWVTSWASMRVSILAIPREVFTHPWFVATLFDAYFGFLWFWLWIAYKEAALSRSLLWLLLLFALGNLAMAAYVMLQLFRLKSGDGAEALLVRRTA